MDLLFKLNTQSSEHLLGFLQRFVERLSADNGSPPGDQVVEGDVDPSGPAVVALAAALGKRGDARPG